MAVPVERIKEVEEALGANDTPRAISLSRAALDEGLEHPLFLNLRAYDHENEGRSHPALFDLMRAVAMAPDDMIILNALGLAYSRVGKMRDAVRIFDTVIERSPRFWQAYFNRGWVSEESGELKAAYLYFERAMQLAPDAPDPAARLAAVAVRLGNWSAARTYAERALALRPDHDIALSMLARADVEDKDYGAAETRLRTVIEDTANPPQHRAHAWSVLGDTFDRQNRVSEAFSAYRQRNDIIRAEYAPQFSAPGIETVPQVFAWLTEGFTQMEPARFAAPPVGLSVMDTAIGHIFMTGFPRSGTTLLEEVFASNPSIVTTQERDALGNAVKDIFSKRSDINLLADLQGAALSRQRRTYWNAIGSFGIDVQGKILLDKQPYNTVKLPLISKLFPNAKVLFCLRDPRDVVLSCFRQNFKMSPTNFEFLTLETAARLYDMTMRLAEIYRAKLPLDLIEVHHEKLIENFEPEVRKICDFVGVPWDDAMRDFAARPNRRAITTPSALQISRGISRAGVGTWRRYAEQMAPILPILQPWVERFGYAPD